MLSYKVKVETKLGSTRSKVVRAESEAEAIAKAKESFPLFQKVWVEGEPQEFIEDDVDEADGQSRIAEMQRDAEIERRKAKRSEGLVWIGVGVILLFASLLFMRQAVLISLAPVLWGIYLFKSNAARIKILVEERAAGLPYDAARPTSLGKGR